MKTTKITSEHLSDLDVKAATLVTCGNCWQDVVVETTRRGDQLAAVLTNLGWNAVTTRDEFIPNCCPTCVNNLLLDHSPH